MRRGEEKTTPTDMMAHRLAYEQMASDCIRILAELGDLTERLDRVVHLLQSATGASRVYIFENEDDPDSGLCMNQISESCADGVSPQIENPSLQHLPYAVGAPSLLPLLEARKPWTGVVADLQGPEWRILKTQHVLSLMIVPIFSEASLWGFIGFDDCEDARKWQDDDAHVLETIASAMGLAISHSKSRKALERRITSERARHESVLRQSEIILEGFLDNAQEFLGIIELLDEENDLRYIRINEAAGLYIGVSPEKIKGMRASDVGVSAQVRRQWIEQCRESERIGMPVHFEYQRETPDGIHTLAAKTSVVQSPYFLFIIADITERKRAEDELRENQAQLSNALQMGRMGHWELDVESGIFTFSDSFYAIFKTCAEEMGGYKMSIEAYAERFVHPEDTALVALEVKKSIMAEENEYSRYLEHRMLYADGTPGYIAVRFFIVKDNDGKTIKTYGVNQDITERKRTEEESKQLQMQLSQAQKIESVGRLAGGVAHDFNNMLNVIMGRAEMAMDELPEGSQIRSDLEEIRKSAQRSANLTRQLLAFARKQTITPKVLDLNEIVSSMFKILRRLIGEGIDLMWRPGEGLDVVCIDPGQIDQLLVNLVVNARDAIGRGATGRVTIETANARFDRDDCVGHAEFAVGDYVMLTVGDDGCGMDEETKANIFEPYFTTKDIGEGTGLGLATVYGIVQQNKGFLSVQSEPGSGTTFLIYLPRYTGKHGQPRQTLSEVRAAYDTQTILVVEDEPAVLRMTTLMLEKLGYAVLPTSKPSEAIRLAKTHPGPIHLLLIDVIMPEMNGRDLAKNILSLFPNMKCLFTSGYTADVIAHHGVLDYGVNFISKPFSRKELATKVKEVLE